MVANITQTVAKQMLGACVLNQTCPEPTRVFNTGSAGAGPDPRNYIFSPRPGRKEKWKEREMLLLNDV